MLLQGKKQSSTQAAGSQILQLSWNQPVRSQDRPLLACRASHWICVYEVSATGAEEPSTSLSGAAASIAPLTVHLFLSCSWPLLHSTLGQAKDAQQ